MYTPPEAPMRLIRLPRPFPMHRGGLLPEVEIAYETWGRLTPERDNAVLLFTGLSPDAHAASSAEASRPGWWEYMVGPGKPIDTDRFFVVCANSLGSCFGSTGPASVDPRSGRPYGVDFPELSIEDIAVADHALLQALEIPRLRAVVGASLGGMAALAFASRFPDQVDNLAVLSAAAHASPFAIAIRSLQREIIRSDPAWLAGAYPPGEGPRNGMRLARKLGLTSYRSAREWQQRFARRRLEQADPSGAEFQIEAYLEANAKKFAETFDANCYLYLSRAMDWFDLADAEGNLDAALSAMTARRVLVVGVESDFLFPLEQQRALAEAFRRNGREVTFTALPSIQGHDAFLVDEARFAPVLRAFFEQLQGG